MTFDVEIVLAGGIFGALIVAVWHCGYRYGRLEMEAEMWRALEGDPQEGTDAES